MNLNHINLPVTDVPAAYRFLERYFGMRGQACNDNIAFLTDGQGMILTLTGTKLGGGAEIRYPANFHVGFGQPSAGHVDDINRRLKEDGYDVPEPTRQHGSWTFYFTAPGGFTIEVLA